MKNLKYLIPVVLGVFFLSALVYTLDFKQSKLELAHSVSSHKVYSQSKNYENNSIVKRSNWDAHFKSHAALQRNTQYKGIKRFQSQKGASLLSVKSASLSNSGESIVSLKNCSMFTSTSSHNNSVKYSTTPENVHFQSQGERTQLIAQNTFNLPMQFSGPPSGGGLGELDDPAMPLGEELFCFSLLLLVFLAHKTYKIHYLKN